MRGDEGFTLIELLIVVVVIGILAAIAIPKFNASREKTFVATLKSDLKTLAIQQEVYHGDNLIFAGDVADTEAGVSESVTITINENTGTGWAATATHVGLAGEQCGMYYGDAAAAGGSPGTSPGVVACTR